MNHITSPEKGLSIKHFIPGITWFFIVLFLICIPGKSVPKIDWLDNIDFDKLIHTAMFGVLVLLFCYPFKTAHYNKEERKNWFIKIALATCIWGLTTELIQRYFIPGRFFDWVDWGADTLGVLIAYFLCRKMFSGQ